MAKGIKEVRRLVRRTPGASNKSVYSNVFCLTIEKFVEYGVPLSNLGVNLPGIPKGETPGNYAGAF